MSPANPGRLAGLSLAVLLLFTALLAGATATAAAQANASDVPNDPRDSAPSSSSSASTTSPNATDPAADCTERIDAIVSLCSAEYNDDTGTATLMMHSTRAQRVVVTDAAAFMSGGEVERRTYTLDGVSEIEMPVTEYQGMVGVSVDTQRVLYAVPLGQGYTLASPHESDIMALVTGIFVVPFAALAYKKWRDRKRRKGVQRVDG